MQQPPLPPMEPIKPSPSVQPQSLPPSSASASQAGTTQTKGRLRQIVGYLGGASLGFIMLVGVGELTLKPGLRPSDVIALVEANVELGLMNLKLGHKPGEHVVTEAEYREIIAKAERDGQAKAEIAFQRKLAVVQADKERYVGAYQTLYQRTNIIAQAGVQMEAVAQQFRQRLYETTNGGRNVVIAVYDGLCAMGDQESCEKARQARIGMIEEAGELTEGHLAQKVAELMADIPDPAALVAARDMQRHDMPAQ